MSEGMVTRTTDTMSEGEVDITKFELVAGQEQVTLRQQLPEMKVGGVYTLYTNGKAHQRHHGYPYFTRKERRTSGVL